MNGIIQMFHSNLDIQPAAAAAAAAAVQHHPSAHVSSLSACEMRRVLVFNADHRKSYLSKLLRCAIAFPAMVKTA
jgi:hypothetical protein